jgi:hypothetical protein
VDTVLCIKIRVYAARVCTCGPAPVAMLGAYAVTKPGRSNGPFRHVVVRILRSEHGLDNFGRTVYHGVIDH